MNRSKKVLTSNIQIQISSSIFNEIQNYKLYATLQSKIYISHITILSIKEFEIQPLEGADAAIVLFKPPSAKTDRL